MSLNDDHASLLFLSENLFYQLLLNPSNSLYLYLSYYSASVFSNRIFSSSYIFLSTSFSFLALKVFTRSRPQSCWISFIPSAIGARTFFIDSSLFPPTKSSLNLLIFYFSFAFSCSTRRWILAPTRPLSLKNLKSRSILDSMKSCFIWYSRFLSLLVLIVSTDATLSFVILFFSELSTL